MFEQFKQPPRAPWIEFLFGVLAGVTVVIISFAMDFVVTLTFAAASGMLFLGSSHPFASFWFILNFAGTALLFLRSRPVGVSVFRAGLVTAFALFMLMDAACWSSHV